MQNASKSLQRCLERSPRSSKGPLRGSNKPLRGLKTTSKNPPRHFFPGIKVGPRQSIHSVNCNTTFIQQTSFQKATASKTAPRSSCAAARKSPSTTQGLRCGKGQFTNLGVLQNKKSSLPLTVGTLRFPRKLGRESKTLVSNNAFQKLLRGF